MPLPGSEGLKPYEAQQPQDVAEPKQRPVSTSLAVSSPDTQAKGGVTVARPRLPVPIRRTLIAEPTPVVEAVHAEHPNHQPARTRAGRVHLGNGMWLPNSYFDYTSDTASPRTVQLKRDAIVSGLRHQPPTESFIELLYKPPEARKPHEDVAVSLIEGLDDFIIAEDDNLLILNKPPGIATHYGKNMPIGLLEVVRELRGPGVHNAHRLDMDTSGVLVFAKSFPAVAEMSEQFGNKQAGPMEKHYAALLDGEFDDDERLEVAADIYRGRHCQMRLVTDDEPTPARAKPKPSQTFFQPLQLFHTPEEEPQPRTLTDVEIITGRTHQIRVTAAQALRRPVTGDKKYNPHPDGAPRQMLHAAKLVYADPMSRDEREVSAHLPLDFQHVLDKLAFVRNY